jgi:hypothetical protein
MTLIELIDAYGIECNYGGSGASSDDSDAYLDEIKRRLDGIERRLDEYRGAKVLREGVRAEIEGNSMEEVL